MNKEAMLAHRKAMDLADEAQLLEHRDEYTARDPFAEAAALEEAAVEQISGDHLRSRGILAVSAVSLWLRAGDLERARELARAYVRESSIPERAWAPGVAEDLERLVGKLDDRRTELQIALDAFLADLETEIVRSFEKLGWQGIALYSPDTDLTGLEAVAASDSSMGRIVRHAFEQDPVLPDIEVDTFRRRRAERVRGGVWDPRYNEYVWTSSRHTRFVDRLFVPLLLIRSRKDGSLHQRECAWRREEDLWFPEADECFQLQPVGTLSVSSEWEMDTECIEKTLRRATRVAAPLAHHASLVGLGERIQTLLVAATGADHAALHVSSGARSLFTDAPPSTIFERDKGIRKYEGASGGVGSAPRQTGIGAEALERGAAVCVSGDELQSRNPELFRHGIRTTWAFPLQSLTHQSIGLIYFHYNTDGAGCDCAGLVEESGRVLGLALRSQQLQRIAVRAQVQAEARRIAYSVHDRKDCVWEMVHFAWNLFGCAHVSLALSLAYGGHVAHAGRYVVDDGQGHDAAAERWRRKLAKPLLRLLPTVGGPSYVTNGVRESLTVSRDGFAASQNFEATAIIPLMDGSLQVGILIVDYRRPHDFQRDRDLIEKLASLFAAGIVHSDNREKAISDFDRSSGHWVAEASQASVGYTTSSAAPSSRPRRSRSGRPKLN